MTVKLLYRLISISGKITFLVFVISFSSCASSKRSYFPPLVEQPSSSLKSHSFTKDVQPILNRRCVNCHSCFDAPAQLNLSCADGVIRGATKDRVYDAARLTPAQHTRLHVDGKTEEDWRRKGFFPVVAKEEVKGVSTRLQTALNRAQKRNVQGRNSL